MMREHASPTEHVARSVASRAAHLVRSNLVARSIPVLIVCAICAAFIVLSSFAISASGSSRRRVGGQNDDSDSDADHDVSGSFANADARAESVPLGANAATQLSAVFNPGPTAEWWAKAPGGSASVCVIVRTYSGHRAALPALLASLLSSGHPGLSLILADTGSGAPFGPEMASIAATFNALAGRRAVVVSSRTRATVRPLFPHLKTEDFGYLVTDAVLSDSAWGDGEGSRCRCAQALDLLVRAPAAVLTVRKKVVTAMGPSPFESRRRGSSGGSIDSSANGAATEERQAAAPAATAAALGRHRVVPASASAGGLDMDCDVLVTTNGGDEWVG